MYLKHCEERVSAKFLDFYSLYLNLLGSLAVLLVGDFRSC